MTRPLLDVDLSYVMGQYPRSCQPERVEHLGAAGGFSGAHFWQLTTPQGRLCLRRWPAGHPEPGQLQQIHEVLTRVDRGGLSIVPVPIRTSGGLSFVEHAGRLWELSAWLPGEADYARRPSPEKLGHAAETLAKFHVAALNSPHAEDAPQPSPGLRQRYEQLTHLLRQDAEAIRRVVTPRIWPELQVRAIALLDLFQALGPRGAAVLQTACRVRLPLQPCIRDIWHDHVLFVGSRVSGIVDFGAMRVESVVGDVTRLFGSLVGDDPALRQIALSAYESVRPLSDAERSVIQAFDQGSVLLSGMNWLKWIYVDRREFEGQERILARLDVTIQRLQHLSGKPF